MATPAAAISRSILNPSQLHLKLYSNYTLLYIGYTSLSIIHTIRLAVLYQMYGMFKFDAAIGGARRDEEKARAKERFNRPCFTAIFLRFSEYLIFWWLSTRWTWLISVKMYMIRLLPTTRRYRPAKAKAFVFLKLLPLQGDIVACMLTQGVALG